MRNALEDLASLHPAYRFGRLAHCRSEDGENRHLRSRHGPEVEGSGSAGPVGELAAAVAMFAVLFAVLAAIAGFTIDAPDMSQQAAAAVVNPAETR
jgi:hypothetical protein